MIVDIKFPFGTAHARTRPGSFTGSTPRAILAFDYVNWRDERHNYVIAVESVEFGPYNRQGYDEEGPNNWVLHGTMIERDGEPRPVGRRSFLIHRLENIEVKEPSA